ncbi:MAG: aquaporin [Candidatus Ancillula sp.]|jgi:hypothetical protein|nr:aquaporin [Candidatus Ancillula sp.]
MKKNNELYYEFLGMYLFVLLPTLGFVLSSKISSSGNGFTAALLTGLGLFVSVLIFAPRGGKCYFNPMFALHDILCKKRKLTFTRGFVFMVVQFVGALCALITIRLMLPTSNVFSASQWFQGAGAGFGDNSPSATTLQSGNLSFGPVSVIVAELIGCLVVLAVFRHISDQEKKFTPVYKAGVLSASFAGVIYSIWALSGASLNPAKALASSVLSLEWTSIDGALSLVANTAALFLTPFVAAVLFHIFTNLRLGGMHPSGSEVGATADINSGVNTADDGINTSEAKSTSTLNPSISVGATQNTTSNDSLFGFDQGIRDYNSADSKEAKGGDTHIGD